MNEFKYKVGDKLIAVNGFEIQDSPSMVPYRYKAGDITEITFINDDGHSYPVNVKSDKYKYHNFSYQEIELYFISLAKFREDRINSILDEE